MRVGFTTFKVVVSAKFMTVAKNACVTLGREWDQMLEMPHQPAFFRKNIIFVGITTFYLRAKPRMSMGLGYRSNGLKKVAVPGTI